MKQSTNQLTSQSDLDQYNLVRENSNLTHENMLFSANRFGDKKIEIGLYSNQSGQERIAQQSIGNYVKQFKNDSKNDRLSILLCNGNVSTNQDQSGKSYQELTGDSHWTTLHLRKDQDGKIHAFYSDSLSHDNNDKKTIPTSVLQALDSSGIESDNINKIRCERQPNLHKCGDHALFNALAMNQTGDELLTSNKVKVKDQVVIINENSANSVTVDQFYQPHRQALAQEFNVRVATYQPKTQDKGPDAFTTAPSNKEQIQSNAPQSLSATLKSQINQLQEGSKASPQEIINIDKLEGNFQKYDQLKNKYDANSEESMIKRAMELSLIEQQNLELLKKFQTQIQPFVDKIKGQNDEHAQDLIDKISSPLVAANLEKFLPIIREIQQDPNKINDHSVQYQFENKIFEAKGTTRQRHSLDTNPISKIVEQVEGSGLANQESWQNRLLVRARSDGKTSQYR